MRRSAMAIRLRLAALLALALLAPGCDDAETGPLQVSAIGPPPELRNPNLQALDPPSALLAEAVAQGLVRFDATGQIEPALAQSWIVSDDGLRYTFRLAEAEWSDGSPVTAEQVAARLRAATSRASRNPLKPMLGIIAEAEAMTEDVLEISLHSARPNFLQLLGQPEMAIVRNEMGTGPFRREPSEGRAVRLSMHRSDEEEDEGSHARDIVLRGESAATAVVRFRRGLADLVVGGTLGNLPVVRAADLPAEVMRLDPVAGMLGLSFQRGNGIWAEAEARRALAMAVDRTAILSAIGIPELLPRETIVPANVDELPEPALPAWSAMQLPARVRTATAILRGLAQGQSPTIRVGFPDGPGYRLLFAQLRRDWRLIGVEAVRAPPEAADLLLVDRVAPATLPGWYLRPFSCAASRICSEEADAALEAARMAQDPAERQRQYEIADRLITELGLYIPITAPVRWSLVSDRVDAFQPNMFGRRFPGTLSGTLSR